MEISAPLVPSSSWRAEKFVSEADRGSQYFQPNRFDVLVHLLALEQLAGGSCRIGRDNGDDVSSADWVRRSDLFSLEDSEPSIGQLAAELLTSPTPQLRVTFASGGQLARGASAAAGSIYSNREATRVDGNDKLFDRSIAALGAAGWTTSDLQELLLAWAQRDPAATVVLIGLDAVGADDAQHELSCRYSVMHTELDHLSLDDATALGAGGSGSMQLLCLRNSASSLPEVIKRHHDSILLVSQAADVSGVLSRLWSSSRATSSSAAHNQRIRRMRRKVITTQLLERALGR